MTFTAHSLETFCYDRVRLFDIVQVMHGPMKGRTGHVVDIRPNGYLSIKEIVERLEPFAEVKTESGVSKIYFN